ncbi:hypothetical protein ACX3OY_00900 [Citrobacter farmeri]
MNTKFPISLVKMLHDDGTDAFRLYVAEAQELLQYMEDKQKKAVKLFESGVNGEFSISKDSYVRMMIEQETKALLKNAQPAGKKTPQKANKPKTNPVLPNKNGDGVTQPRQSSVPTPPLSSKDNSPVEEQVMTVTPDSETSQFPW